MRFDDRQWAGLLLFVGTAQYLIIGLIIAEAVYPDPPGYSVSKNAISDLGVAPALPVFSPSVILLGLIVLAIAWFLFRAFRDRPLSIVAALAGVGAIAVGIFTEDLGFIHSLVSLWTFVVIALSPIFPMRVVPPPFQYIFVILGVI